MANITLKGGAVHTKGELPKINEIAKNFKLVRSDLKEVSLDDYKGKIKVLNIYPSLDTPTCSLSVKSFYKKIKNSDKIVVLNVSYDLPFAAARFCSTSDLTNVEVLSAFRSSFADDYNLKIIDSPLAGLCSRAVILLDENNKVLYTEQVKEIADEPNYENVLKRIQI